MGKPKQIEKKDLIHAARKLLLKSGQASVTLKNVAETSGVTQGVTYYHFKTKQELLLSLLKQYGEDMLKEVQNKSVKTIFAGEMYKAQTSSEELHLLTELIAISLHNKELKQHLGHLIKNRNRLYSEALNGDIVRGRLLAALLDGLAIQAVCEPGFPEKEMYLLAHEMINQLSKKES